MLKPGDQVNVENQFTRPGSARVTATVLWVDPPFCKVRFSFNGKVRLSKHRIEDVEQV